LNLVYLPIPSIVERVFTYDRFFPSALSVSRTPYVVRIIESEQHKYSIKSSKAR